jgi:diguanylate cyclase
MTRREDSVTPRRLSAGFVAVGAALIILHLLVDNPTISSWCYALVVGMLPIAAVISWWYVRLPRVVWIVTVIGATSFIVAKVAEMIRGDDDSFALKLTENIATFLGLMLLASLLVSLVHRRRGRLVLTTLTDAAIVALTGWLVVYVSLVLPTLDRATDPTFVTIVAGLYQPIGIASLFLLTVLLFADTFRTPAVWLLAATITLNIGGDLVYALIGAGHIDIDPVYADTIYLLGFLCGACTLMHPSAHSLVERTAVGESRSQTVRILMTTSCLLIPIGVLGFGTSDSEVDRLVRFASAVAIVAFVVIRVGVTLRSVAADQRRLLSIAQHDPLTGLPNRSLLGEQITGALHESWRTSSRPTVLFIDLDRFKNINDSLGHAVGDEVLRLVGRRLRLALPERVIVGRISGDEFMAIDPDVFTTGEAMEFAERVLSVFREPFHIGAGDLYVTASVGLAMANGSASAEELHRNSDTAMYRAKEAGRNCVAMYDDTMHERVAHRLQIESALHRALDRRELHLNYQPIVDVATMEVVGFEALMRWQLNDGRLISPAEFIPIAEDTGLIISIGSWALLEALTQLDTWIRAGVCSPTASMSVNVSPRQLRDPHLVSAVSEALMRSSIAPSQLWLEVTESVMIAEPEQALAILRRIKALGVRVAIDDFGTGYSSLSHLRRFPLQRIKIDRAFISGVAEDESSRSLVRTIIAMAHSLGLDVVAEGVESLGQLEALAALECSMAQGYLLSVPVPGDSMRATLEGMPRPTPPADLARRRPD